MSFPGFIFFVCPFAFRCGFALPFGHRDPTLRPGSQLKTSGPVSASSVPGDTEANRRECMFKTIMVPIDLGHLPKIDRALATAADLAKHYGAELTYVSVTAATPGPLAHNPKEFATKLEAFAKEDGGKRGVVPKAHSMVAHDPTTDVDDVLIKAVDEIGADLVVMASHKPGFAEYFWPSNGGKLAGHTGVSVMLVRDA